MAVSVATAIGVVLVIGFMAATACLSWSNAVFFTILKEVNSRCEPKDRFTGIFVSTYSRAVIKRHQELYPDSRLRKRMKTAQIVGFLLFFGVVVAAVALNVYRSDGSTASPHTHSELYRGGLHPSDSC